MIVIAVNATQLVSHHINTNVLKGPGKLYENHFECDTLFILNLLARSCLTAFLLSIVIARIIRSSTCHHSWCISCFTWMKNTRIWSIPTNSRHSECLRYFMSLHMRFVVSGFV